MGAPGDVCEQDQFVGQLGERLQQVAGKESEVNSLKLKLRKAEDAAAAAGKPVAAGKAVSLNDLSRPLFALGTEADHVAPWPSVYKINLLTDTAPARMSVAALRTVSSTDTW